MLACRHDARSMTSEEKEISRCSYIVCIHYRKTGLCHANNRTAKDPVRPAKALLCADARQRTPGKASDGSVDVAVRIDHLHGKALCRAHAGLPCAPTLPCGLGFAVRANVAVRFECKYLLPQRKLVIYHHQVTQVKNKTAHMLLFSFIHHSL
jgi:hypothetical protein